MATRPVLRIFISSTAVDLRDYRDKVRDAVLRLENLPIAMETFSASGDCAYAWGQADGLHFCGLAHLRLGERELARQRLTAALELRERLGHGRIEETRRALELCRA